MQGTFRGTIGCAPVVRSGRRDRGLEDVDVASTCWCLRTLDGVFVVDHLLLNVREVGAIQDQMSQFWQGDPVHRVQLKDALNNVVQVVGERKNRGKEVWVLDEGAERFIRRSGRAFPRITSASEVDKDHA